ncbi:MAG TPA: IclR family transcriptional regulator [Micromonosporaceae bacterium]|jgi:IclR family acetate operon transcriptional repressor
MAPRKRKASAEVAQPRSGSIQSLARAFDLLERLADAGGEAGLSELATACDLPLATTHRLTQTLASLGYLRRGASRRYVLGPRLIRLGQAASQLLGQWTQPVLAELVELTGETANMAILDGDGIVYVAQAPSRHSMRMFTEVGRRVSAHSTGVGKAILSQLPEPRVAQLLGRAGMPAMTATTITSLDRFLEELALTRRRGYAVDNGEQEVGVSCIAVPVAGAPTPAAISVSGPEGRVSPLLQTATLNALRRSAGRLSAVLGELTRQAHQDRRDARPT